MNNTEIERKFTMTHFPTMDECQYISAQHIQQFYIPCNDGVMRIIKRSSSEGNAEYFLTHNRIFQDYDESVCVEFEEQIPESVFEMLKLTAVSYIEKIRHKITFDNRLWEIDHFLASTMGSFFMAEVELQSIDEKIVLIGGIDEDVSNVPQYKNKNLAVKL